MNVHDDLLLVRIKKLSMGLFRLMKNAFRKCISYSEAIISLALTAKVKWPGFFYFLESADSCLAIGTISPILFKGIAEPHRGYCI